VPADVGIFEQQQRSPGGLRIPWAACSAREALACLHACGIQQQDPAGDLASRYGTCAIQPGDLMGVHAQQLCRLRGGIPVLYVGRRYYLHIYYRVVINI
jgi:hypothetical protein